METDSITQKLKYHEGNITNQWWQVELLNKLWLQKTSWTFGEKINLEIHMMR